MELLNKEGLYTGSSGTYLRNVAACSRWCLYNAIPMSNLAYKLNNLHADVALPGKTNISLSGCDFSCVRSRTSDIGVISRAEIELTDRKCKKCTLCVKEPLGCQVDAIRITDNGVIIDTDKCVRCGFCSNICRPGTISVQFRSFDIFVGGRGGIKPGEAVFYKRIQTEEEVIAEIARILGRYSKKAHEGERIGDMMERLGIKALEE
ncbi:MAG TPA: hypothetical protein ENH38_03720 [Nitrospirae bacterium]|nr:hypothetical protein [Nitrospirota bacterium]